MNAERMRCGFPATRPSRYWKVRPDDAEHDEDDDGREERNHQGDERKEGGKLLGSRTPVDDKK